MSSSPTITEGVAAPAFVLADQSGGQLRLADLIGSRHLVVFFYPRDNTLICTQEAKAFRDHYDRFKAAGAEVVGISDDSSESHAGFCAEHNLPFKLLADPEGRVRKSYGVDSALGAMGNRVTMVIDRQGVIRFIYRSALRAQKHAESALAAVQGL